MEKVYRLKDNIEFQSLIDLGFTTDDWKNFYKVVPVDDELMQFLLDTYYLNPEWIKEVYEPNKKDIIKTINLKYTKTGKIRKTKEMEAILHAWKLELCEDEDYWLGFSSLDPHNLYVFYNMALVDKYFPGEIAELKRLRLVEEYEIKPEDLNEG